MVVATQAHTKKSERAVVTSTHNFFRFLGFACGIAVSAVVFQSTLTASLPTEHKDLVDAFYALERLNSVATEAIAPAYESVIRYIFITSVGSSVLYSLRLLVWKDYGYESRSDEGNEYTSVRKSEEQDEEDPLFSDRRLSLPSYGAVPVEAPDHYSLGTARSYVRITGFSARQLRRPRSG